MFLWALYPCFVTEFGVFLVVQKSISVHFVTYFWHLNIINYVLVVVTVMWITYVVLRPCRMAFILLCKIWVTQLSVLSCQHISTFRSLWLLRTLLLLQCTHGGLLYQSMFVAVLIAVITVRDESLLQVMILLLNCGHQILIISQSVSQFVSDKSP